MAAHGYSYQKKKSSANTAIMVRGSDKFTVRIGYTGKWIFCSVRDSITNGTVIDFHMHITGDNWTDTKKALDAWGGYKADNDDFVLPTGKFKGQKLHNPKPNQYVLNLEPAEKDPDAVQKQYNKTRAVTTHPYLTNKKPHGRSINHDLLTLPRFLNSFRNNEYQSVVFPHYDQDELTGFEIKNTNFTGFAKGGTKSLWSSVSNKSDTALVITETAIDALSYAQLHPQDIINARYVSVGGGLNPVQSELIRREVEKYNYEKVLLATDNDEGGDDIAEAISAVLENLDTDVTLAKPPIGKNDWNKVLTG